MLRKIKEIYTKEKSVLMVSLFIGFCFTASIAVATAIYSQTIQGGIAEKVVRFHVLANSDSKEDQEIKQAVKDAVLENMKGDMEKAKSLSETIEILSKNTGKIQQTAIGVINGYGKNYNVKVDLSREMFPQKQYGDVVFPAGRYDALRIVIGEGGGYNWWCVMYPPLCYVDGTHSEITKEAKEELKNILTEEEYQIVVTSKSEEYLTPKIKFKIVELWQEWGSNGQYATKP